MKNTFIDSAGKIQMVLAGAVTANQLQWTCSYYDRTLSTGVIVEGEYSGVSNNTTPVDILVAPASGHIRVMKNVTVYNADTATAVVILQLVDGGGTRILIRNSLTTLASWSADDMSFYTDISGKANIASPTFTGTVTLPTTVLGETSFQLDPAISADGKWSGITTTGTAGATLTFGQLCYLATSGKRLLAKADVEGVTSVSKLGICILAAGADTNPTEMLLYGSINAAAAFPTLTVGAPVYVDVTTAGNILVTQPSGANQVIRKIGFGNTADELFFHPDQSYVTHS